MWETDANRKLGAQASVAPEPNPCLLPVFPSPRAPAWDIPKAGPGNESSLTLLLPAESETHAFVLPGKGTGMGAETHTGPSACVPLNHDQQCVAALTWAQGTWVALWLSFLQRSGIHSLSPGPSGSRSENRPKGLGLQPHQVSEASVFRASSLKTHQANTKCHGKAAHIHVVNLLCVRNMCKEYLLQFLQVDICQAVPFHR